MERTTSFGLVLITSSSRFFQETKNLKNRGVSKNNRYRTPSVIEVYLGRFSEFFEGCLALCLRVSPRSDFSGNGSYMSKRSQWEFFKKNHTGTYVRDPPVSNFPISDSLPDSSGAWYLEGTTPWEPLDISLLPFPATSRPVIWIFWEPRAHIFENRAGHSFPIPDRIPTNRF